MRPGSPGRHPRTPGKNGCGCSMSAQRLIHVLGVVILVGALVASPFTWNDLYIQNVIILIMFLAIMASTWNIMGGFTGYISLGHSAFLGVGAYTTAILVVQLGWPWWAGPDRAGHPS